MNDSGLSGRLSEFNLEEILQLVALQQKTGLLRVDASYPMTLYFEQGLLVSYRDRRGVSGDPLETFLKSYGFFAHSAWEHIDFVQRNSELDLTEILVNEGLLTTEELAAAEQQSAQEHLHLGMLLRDGRYQFLSGRAHLSGLKGRVRMKADGLLMEAVRRIDEMPSLQERYHEGEAKIRRASDDVELSKLSDGIRRVWTLLDDERTVNEIVERARMSQFELLTTLEAMREQHWISIHAPVGQRAIKGTTRDSNVYVREESATPAGIALAFLALILLPVLWWWQPAAKLAGHHPEAAVRSQMWRHDAERAHLERSLETFFAGHQSYPPTLEALTGVGLLPDDNTVVQRWNYRCSPNRRSYELSGVADPSLAAAR